MAFFIVEREATDGGLRLPVSGTFATREEALAALSAAAASGDATVTGSQLYVVDLEATVPVLVIPAAEVTVPTIDSESAEAATAEPVSPAAADEPEPGTPPAGESGAIEQGVSLAEALKRAASSLEESGIRAPESVGILEDDDQGMQDVPEREDVAAVTNEEVDEQHESEIAAQAYIAPGLRDLPVVTAVAEPMSAPIEWPWANVEAYEPDEEESGREFESGSASEDVDTLIASAPPVGEDAYLPKPVILGDYGDTTADEVSAVFRKPAPADEVSAAFRKPAAAHEGASEDGPSVPGQGYEVSGSLDMSAYTCNDCIYSNTCPKVGEVTPAECGTFQWRSS